MKSFWAAEKITVRSMDIIYYYFNGLEIKQSRCYYYNYFPGEEKPLHNSWPGQEHPPGGRRICIKVNNQDSHVMDVNTLKLKLKVCT